MKKCKRYLSLLLACMLALALLPGQVLADTVKGAYSVLAESTITASGFGTPYQNYNVVDGKRIVEYTGSGIREVTVSESVYWMQGFSNNGYAVAYKSKTSPEMFVDTTGKVVYRAPEGVTLVDFSHDGYAIFWDNESGNSFMWDSHTNSRKDFHNTDHIPCFYSEGVLGVRYASGGYSCCDENENLLFGRQVFDEVFPMTNGHIVVGYDNGHYYCTEVLDKSGNVIMSSAEARGTIVSDGLIRAQEEGPNGGYWDSFVDMNGNIVISGIKSGDYFFGSNFHNGYAAVYKCSDLSSFKIEYALIDTKGSKVIPYGAYKSISNVSETGIVWTTDQNNHVCVLDVGNASEEYIYDVPDPGEDMKLPVDRLDRVTDPASAASAVSSLTSSMTSEQKQAPTCVDLATLYAENAVAKAASKAVNATEIIVSAATVADLEEVAVQAGQSVESALSNGGVTTVRDLAAMVTLATDVTGELTIRVEPDILTTGVDKVRISAPTFALVLDIAELEGVLTEDFVFTAEDVGTGFAPIASRLKPTININLPKITTITVALPADSGKTTYQTVVNTEGAATASKYNPATTKIEGKVNTSGKYTVTTNEVDFNDISNKSAEMQKAIRYLASKGIINGTSSTTFSPDSSISRAEIAALLVRALGWNDNSAVSAFKDVSRNNWFYSAAASSQKRGLINGFPDNTFQGTRVIDKDQIMTVAGRVLVNKMGYKVPSNPSSYLTRYKDGVVDWAQKEVALATKENLVVYRTDGTFKGASGMTRGDAAIVIYRLFQKIW